PARNQEDGATYDLVQVSARSFRKSTNADAANVDADPTSPWEREGITKKDWALLLRDLAKRKGRLDPPPRENARDRESYLSLRELILTDAAARKAFLGVHWKGRPSSLVLLCELLSKGSLVPDVETDGAYLEAELDHLDQDLEGREGEWDVGHSWTVVREKGAGERDVQMDPEAEGGFTFLLRTRGDFEGRHLSHHVGRLSIELAHGAEDRVERDEPRPERLRAPDDRVIRERGPPRLIGRPSGTPGPEDFAPAVDGVDHVQIDRV